MNKIEIDNQTGLIKQVNYIASPNFNERPENMDIDLLVIHSISLPPGQFSGNAVIDFFTNKLKISSHTSFASLENVKVSTHLFIRRDGEIIQFVPFHKRAWHAGVSRFAGRENCNDFSIGVELEGSDDMSYENIQYTVLGKVTQALCNNYTKITQDRIVGHCDIAPERKTDPGPYFDWHYYRKLMVDY